MREGYPYVVSFEIQSDALASGDDVFKFQVPHSPLTIEKPDCHGPISSILEPVAEWVSPRLNALKNPGLRVGLGIKADADLLYGHNLHSYSVAFADRIKAATGVQFNSLVLTKRHTESSELSVFSSGISEKPSEVGAVEIVVRKSYAKPEYAQLVYEATSEVLDIGGSEDPLRVEIAYKTGFPRTWSRLWKPTLLGILGPKTSSANAARVIDLSFRHLSVGPAFGHQVEMKIAASTLERS